MRKIAAACVALVGLSSCEAIGSIFKAGVWVGIIAVIVVVGLIIGFAGGKKS